VTDALMDNLQIFSPQGDLLLVVGRKGSRSGEFQSPGGIAIDARGRIYVVETLNKRIQIFQYHK
jgi:DNA-binding beta-propeller fold protein YncE